LQFNDRSSTATLLATRRSGKARDLIAPGPDAAQRHAILAAAARVPDHGKLAPWRLVQITDRDAFATLLTASHAAAKPGAGRMELAAIDSFARQAPWLVVLISRVNTASHIPEWEQLLSAGAAAQNLLLAAHAQGFAGNWLTGPAAYDPAVIAAIGQPGDRIAGFFFVGTPARDLEERPRPVLDAIVSGWPATPAA
jgi:nitroreductase